MKSILYSSALLMIVFLSACQQEAPLSPQQCACNQTVGPNASPNNNSNPNQVSPAQVTALWIYSAGAPAALSPEPSGGPGFAVVFKDSTSSPHMVWTDGAAPALIQGHRYFGNASSLPDSVIQQQVIPYLNTSQKGYVVIKIDGDLGPGHTIYTVANY